MSKSNGSRGLRGRFFDHFKNKGLTRKHVIDLPDDVFVVANRADRRQRARNIRPRVLIATSPRMRHGNHGPHRTSVMRRARERYARQQAATS